MGGGGKGAAYVDPTAKRLARAAATRKARERVSTEAGESSASRRRLDTIGHATSGFDDGTDLDKPLSENSDFQESKEFGDDVLAGSRNVDEDMNGDSASVDESQKTDKKPRASELVDMIPCELTREALHSVLGYHWDLDDEVQRNTISLTGQHGRLANVEGCLPTRMDIYPEKGGSLIATRQLLSGALGRQFFRGLAMSLNNWWEVPLQMFIVDANPNITSQVAQMVKQLNPKLHPSVKGSTKVHQQNEQAKCAKAKLKEIAERYQVKYKLENRYEFNVSWPASLKLAEDADSWSVGITLKKDEGERILMVCSYDHERQREEFITDTRVLDDMEWKSGDVKEVLDNIIAEVRMYREDIFYIPAKDEVDPPPLETCGKQKYIQPGKGASKNSAEDMTPPPAGEGLLGAKGIPASMQNRANPKGFAPNVQTQSSSSSGQQGFGQASQQQHFGMFGKAGPYPVAQTGAFKGYIPRPPAKGQRVGDWVCERCGDFQFARNRQCRACGGPPPGQPGMPAGFGLQPQKGMGGPIRPIRPQGQPQFPPEPPPTYTPAEWLQRGGEEAKPSNGDIAWMAEQLRSFGVQVPF